MMRFIRIFPPRRRVLAYLILLAAFVAVKLPLLIHFRLTAMSGPEFKQDVLERRAYLAQRIIAEKLSISDMPILIGKRFRGEWLLGTYSMFAAAVTNIAFLFPETKNEALSITERAVEELMKPETRAFDTEGWSEDALVDVGSRTGHVAYYGHLAMALGAFKVLGGDNRFDPLYREVVGSIRRSIRAGKRHCGESYPEERYIMDNVVALAAISTFDQITGSWPDPDVTAWMDSARRELIDPRTGLLYFSLNPDGTPLLGSRGSGAGWNSFYLPFASPEFADEQFERLRAALDETALGLFRGIREYPRGYIGIGDVDSGPVILGLSPSGTGFAVAGARRAKDERLFSDLLFTAEAAGTTVGSAAQRRYLFAPLVGDAILLAMKTATPWDSRFLAAKAPYSNAASTLSASSE